jgi:outer membrane protein assembly factor BamB
VTSRLVEHRPRTFVRAAAVAACALALAMAAMPARAHPVRIGRYAEIPYGIRPEHPYASARGSAHREGRLRGRVPAQAPARVYERALRHRHPSAMVLAADGTLYVGTTGGLSAIDAASGNERWTERIGSIGVSPSLAPSDDVVVVTNSGLAATVTRDGVVRYTADLGAPARVAALVSDDGSLVVATADQRIRRFDASLRRARSGGLREAPSMWLALTRRGHYVFASPNLLTALDAELRVSRQISIAGTPSAGPIVADDGTLWVATIEGVIHAVDPSGRVRARTDVGSRMTEGAAPALGHDGALRVPTQTGGLVCLGPGGTERWRFANEAGYGKALSIDDDDTTLAVDMQGRMSAIAADGTERWRVSLGVGAERTRSLHAPILGPDGTIYVLTERPAIQAWR